MLLNEKKNYYLRTGLILTGLMAALALGVAFVPSYARVIRSEFARHREMNYVKSARLMGAGHLRIMFLHILPNTRQPPRGGRRYLPDKSH